MPFTRKRDYIQVLGWLRASDPATVSELTALLTVAEPLRHAGDDTAEDVRPLRDGRGTMIHGIAVAEYIDPAPAALARIGMPALGPLGKALTSRQSSEAEVEAAARAVYDMLGDISQVWTSANRSLPASRIEVVDAVRQSRGGPFDPSVGDKLWHPPLLSAAGDGSGPPPPPRDPGGMESASADVRFATMWNIRIPREEQANALEARAMASGNSAENRRSAATTLGLLRDVPYFAIVGGPRFNEEKLGNGLIVMLAEEDVQPGKPLDEMMTPAALALVRIDLPYMPILTKTIATSDSARLRSNCAGVMTVMLGKLAKPWLEAVVNDYTGERQKAHLQEQIAKWGPYCAGDGYWEAQSQATSNSR
jgi:hypothetical protein